MTEIFAVTLLIVLILLADSYLRFLPFSARLDDEIKRRLRRRQLVCSIVAVPIIANIFLVNGIIAASFKAVLMLGWIPCVLIQVLTVKGKTLQHIYIVGMFGLWCLLQHNWASILDVVFWLDRPESVILIIHSIEYLILFVVLLPLERRCFLTLLPADAFFENRPQSYYIALMPFVLGLGHLLLWADERLLHSWGERLSRLYLLPVFLFLWRYILAGAQRFFEHRRTMRESRMMEEQLSALERHNRAMRDNQRQMEELQKNLRAEYEMIARRLRSGDPLNPYIRRPRARRRALPPPAPAYPGEARGLANPRPRSRRGKRRSQPSLRFSVCSFFRILAYRYSLVCKKLCMRKQKEEWTSHSSHIKQPHKDSNLE